MSKQRIAPWGEYPTPLVPATVIEAIGENLAPDSFKRVLGEDARIRDLSQGVWNKVSNVNDSQISELVTLLRKNISKFKSKHIYSELPEDIPLSSFPYSTRTRNIVANNIYYFRSNNFLTYEKALTELPNFGIKSAIEFSCVVESVISEIGFFSSSVKGDALVEFHSEEWQKIASFYQQLAAWALGERQIGNFSELLPPPTDYWPDDIKLSWKQLSHLETRNLAGENINLYSVPFLVAQLLAQIDERLEQVLLKRIFPTHEVESLNKIGDSLGITRERVRQLEKKAIAILEENVGRDGFSPVLRRAQKMRSQLGSAFPDDSRILQGIVDDFTNDFLCHTREKSFAQSLLLWLAGPYKIHSDWLLVDKFLPDISDEELRAIRDDRGLITWEAICKVLCDLDIREDFHDAWIEHIGYDIKIEEGIINAINKTENILDKAELLIRYFDRPMAAEEIINYVGGGEIRSVRARLMADERFWRININNEFILAETEGYEQYTTIVDKVLEELDYHGGIVPFEHLVESINNKFGVQKTSVIAYLNTPMFATDDEQNIYLANVNEVTIEGKNIEQTPSCYRTLDGNWCLRVKLDEHHIRGSGSMLPISFAKELGCTLGDRISLETQLSPISITWLSSSVQGATIGSLKPVVDNTQGRVGDYLFIVCSRPILTFRLLKQSDIKNTASDLCRLSILLGGECTKNEDVAIAHILKALGISASSNREMMLTEAKTFLSARGEDDLASLIPDEVMSVDYYLEKMGELL